MSAPVVLALDFGGSKMAFTVADETGDRIATTVVATRSGENARVNFDLGITTARALLAEAAPGRRLSAVGASSFGNPYEDRVDVALAIHGWDRLAFGRELRAAFPGTPLCFANDVKAAARAEVASGALTGCNPGLYLNLGTGLAVAIVIDGAVVAGAHGTAGEVGYGLSRPADVGNPAAIPFEHSVGGGALDRRARAAGLPSAAALLASAGPEIVDPIVDELAMHVVNMTALIDPVRIVVGGGMTHSWGLFGPRFARALEAHTPFPPELVLAHHPDEAPLLGALALALDARRSQHRVEPSATAARP